MQQPGTSDFCQPEADYQWDLNSTRSLEMSLPTGAKSVAFNLSRACPGCSASCAVEAALRACSFSWCLLQMSKPELPSLSLADTSVALSSR